MLTKEFTETFARIYADNYVEIRELDDSLLKIMPYSQWKELIVNRSVRVREICAENESLLERLKSELQAGLDEESAHYLYEGLRFLYEGAFDDYGVMKLMSDHLITYYEKTGDFEKLIFINHLMGFESFEFKGRILGEEGCDEAIAYFYKVLSYADRYTEVSDERIRKCFFTAYNNLIAPVSQTATKLRNEIFSFYNAAYALWEKPEVQKLDGGNEDFHAALAQMDEDMLFMEDYFWELSEEKKEQYIDFVGKLRVDKDDEYAKESGAFVRASAIHRLLTGEATPNEIVEEAIAYIDSLPIPKYSDEEDIYPLFHVLNYHNTSCFILNILKCYDFTDEEKRRYTNQFIPKVTEIHTHVPYDYCTSQINQVCGEWYKEIGSFLGDFETKKDFLMQLIVCRQPATYIHSLMVKEIASLITRSLLKHKPELFIGVSSCKDVTDVNDHRAEILSLAENSGLLHDVGKCNIVEVINNQSRRLTNEEFGLIKSHPSMGSELFWKDQDFDDYHDVMMGHHRSYDGKRGYPEDFDNTASHKRILIDIITISDCIDAATDVLGRNYATGKSFSVVAEELKNGAGTQYNPMVVEHIYENKILWDNLEYITGEGRGQIYYQAYQDVLKVSHEKGYYYVKLT